MLCGIFPNLANVRPIAVLRTFLRSVPYAALVILIMVVSEVGSLELFAFWTYFVMGLLSILFCEDSLPVLPIVLCAYMTVSRPNSTVHYLGSTMFDDPSSQIQLFILIGLCSALLLGHLAYALFDKRRRKTMPCLLGGFLLLGAAYMLGGSFTEFYDGRTLLFAFLQPVSLTLFYVYFHYTLRWEDIDKGYFPALFCGLGMGIFVQIVGMYTYPSVIQGGAVIREELYTGWGTYNNVACIMGMCIPAPFYFAVTKKHGWIYTLLGTFFYLSTLLTQSRGGMVFGSVTFFLCTLYAVRVAKREEVKGLFAVPLAMFAGMAVLLLAFPETVGALFHSVIEAGLDSSNRFELYAACWKIFLKHPVFGVGFYATPGFAFDSEWSFLPPRAHDTYLQLLATGGLVLFAAYAFHRYQTIVLLLKSRSAEKWFALFCILAMLLMSIVDCHFFNIGPPILYGIVLGYAENSSRMRSPNQRRLL